MREIRELKKTPVIKNKLLKEQDEIYKKTKELQRSSIEIQKECNQIEKEADNLYNHLHNIIKEMGTYFFKSIRKGEGNLETLLKATTQSRKKELDILLKKQQELYSRIGSVHKKIMEGILLKRRVEAILDSQRPCGILMMINYQQATLAIQIFCSSISLFTILAAHSIQRLDILWIGFSSFFGGIKTEYSDIKKIEKRLEKLSQQREKITEEAKERYSRYIG